MMLTVSLVGVFESDVRINAPLPSPYYSASLGTDSVKLYLGEIPDGIISGLRASRAMAHQLLGTLFNTGMSWEQALATQIAWPMRSESKPSLTVVVAEGCFEISETDLIRGQQLNLSAEKLDEVKADVLLRLEPLYQAAIVVVSSSDNASYFSHRVDRRLIASLGTELVLLMPELKMAASGSVTRSMALGDASKLSRATLTFHGIPENLQGELWNAHRWHLLSLNEPDRWKLFQFGFLSIEKLVEALLNYQPATTAETDAAKQLVSIAESGLGINRQNGRPSKVTIRYAILALRKHPSDASERVRSFIVDREIRNEMAHGKQDANADGEQSRCVQLYADLYKAAIGSLIGT